MEIEQEYETVESVVKGVLEADVKARNSDKWLILEVLRAMGFNIYINYGDFKKMPSFETITRCARKIREINPNLCADEKISEFKNEKRETIRKIMQGNETSINVPSMLYKTKGIEVANNLPKKGGCFF
jgi:hypothetical protein